MNLIALVTCAKQSALTPDDELLGAALVGAGHGWRAVPWNDPGADWSSFAGVVIRSTWDYHLNLPAFLDWIASVEAAGVPVWNSPDMVRWNTHKGYLRELEAAGVDVVPTAWIARGDTVDLTRVMADRAWNEAVVKPAVSATAHGVIRTVAADAAAHDFALTKAAAGVELLVQPFMPEIAQGELSVIFLDGEYSHAVRKRPKAGEYRVQSKFGGSVDPVDLSAAIIERARSALSFVRDPLYARVDGLDVDDRFILMELELIEPELFFHTASLAAARLVRGIARRIGALA